MNKKILSLLILIGIGLVILCPSLVSASCPPPATIGCIVTNIRDELKPIGLAIIVIAWVIAGILYLVSAGSQTMMATAKKALLAAAIGTVLVLVASEAATIAGQILGTS